MYEGCSKGLQKSSVMYLFCKLDELYSYSYIDKHYLYLYRKFCCLGLNTMVTAVTMETICHDYPPTVVHLYQNSLFNNDVVFHGSCPDLEGGGGTGGPDPPPWNLKILPKKG